MENKEIKEMVKQKYSVLALQNDNQSSCCSSGCCSSDNVYNIMNEDYSKLDGYEADADLGLGCGLPTAFAGLKKGDFVVDLGSGAGNDCFVARAEVGETGKVIGIDFTDAMIEKARSNAQKRGFTNVTFRKGDIEDMPIGGNSVDVVISNCVLNLLPSKDKIFHEIFRVLKPGGHFCISDVVLEGELPESIKQVAELYAGCIAGAIPKEQYMVKIFSAGFLQVKIQKEKPIVVPDDILKEHLDEKSFHEYKENNSKIFSITVTGVKPESACDCSSGCC